MDGIDSLYGVFLAIPSMAGVPIFGRRSLSRRFLCWCFFAGVFFADVFFADDSLKQSDCFHCLAVIVQPALR